MYVFSGSSPWLAGVDIFFCFYFIRAEVCRTVRKADVCAGGTRESLDIYMCTWGLGDERRRLGSDSIATQMDLANRRSL